MATRLELLNVRIEDTKMLHCSKKKKKKIKHVLFGWHISHLKSIISIFLKILPLTSWVI